MCTACVWTSCGARNTLYWLVRDPNKTCKCALPLLRNTGIHVKVHSPNRNPSTHTNDVFPLQVQLDHICKNAEAPGNIIWVSPQSGSEPWCRCAFIPERISNPTLLPRMAKTAHGHTHNMHIVQIISQKQNNRRKQNEDQVSFVLVLQEVLIIWLSVTNEMSAEYVYLGFCRRGPRVQLYWLQTKLKLHTFAGADLPNSSIVRIELTACQC